MRAHLLATTALLLAGAGGAWAQPISTYNTTVPLSTDFIPVLRACSPPGVNGCQITGYQNYKALVSNVSSAGSVFSVSAADGTVIISPTTGAVTVRAGVIPAADISGLSSYAVTSFGGVAGAITLGTNLSMAGNTLNATGGGGGNWSAPAVSATGASLVNTSGTLNVAPATPSQLGGVTVSTGLNVSGGAVSVSYGTTSGTAAQGNDSRITGAAQTANNLSDLASASTARINLGLGALATAGYPAAGLVHSTGSAFGAETIGSGLSESSGTLSNSGVTSLGGLTGSVTCGTNVTCSGGTISAGAGLSSIAADSLLMNATAGSAVPTAVSPGNCAGGASALNYSTATHAWSCNTISGGSATSITPGTTTISSGTSGKLEYNNSGTLGEIAASSLAFTTGSLSLAGNLTTTGAYAVSLAFPGAYTYTFPTGTVTLLATNGSGALLTTLNGSAVASGTVSASYLPSFGAAAAGIVPLSGGGTSNYLRADGAWTAPAGTYSLPAATSSTLGGVKPDGTTIANSSGAISIGSIPGSAIASGTVSASYLPAVSALSGTVSATQLATAIPSAATAAPECGSGGAGAVAACGATMVLPSGTAATTQTTGDSTTKIATDAFVANTFAAPPALGNTTPAAVTGTTVTANSGALTAGHTATAGSVVIYGGTSGTATINAPAAAGSAAQTLPGGATNGTLLASVTAPAANPATGTPSSTTYLRGDGTWATPSGAGITGPGITVVGAVPTWGNTTGTSLAAGAAPSVPAAGLVASTGTTLTPATVGSGLTLTGTTLAPDSAYMGAQPKSAVAITGGTASGLTLTTPVVSDIITAPLALVGTSGIAPSSSGPILEVNAGTTAGTALELDGASTGGTGLVLDNSSTGAHNYVIFTEGTTKAPFMGIWDSTAGAMLFYGYGSATQSYIQLPALVNIESNGTVGASLSTPFANILAIGTYADTAAAGDASGTVLAQTFATAPYINTITSMTWASSVVTVTTTAPHGISSGQTVNIAGATPTSYNGQYTATNTGPYTFTYPLASNPGTVTVQGTFAPVWVTTSTCGGATPSVAAGANLGKVIITTGATASTSCVLNGTWPVAPVCVANAYKGTTPQAIAQTAATTTAVTFSFVSTASLIINAQCKI